MNRYIKKIKQIILRIRYIKQLKMTEKSRFILDGKTRFDFENDSKINIKGELITGVHAKNNNKNTYIRLDKNSSIQINGKVSIFYGTELILYEESKLIIGNNTFINSNSSIRCKKNIVIGNNCAIAHGVSIMDSNYHKINGKIKEEPVIIEDNVWIGANSVILSGVTIGKGSIIAAGTIVNKDVPPHSMVAGNPGKIKKENISWSL